MSNVPTTAPPVMKTAKKTAEQLPKKREAAPIIYQKAMATATIPVKETDTRPELEPEIPESVLYPCDRLPPTRSDRRVASGRMLCLCPNLDCCCLTATLDRPSRLPDWYTVRYYPCDFGWWQMRHWAKRLREEAGIQDFPIKE